MTHDELIEDIEVFLMMKPSSIDQVLQFVMRHEVSEAEGLAALVHLRDEGGLIERDGKLYLQRRWTA
jgi:hypothetical protein